MSISITNKYERIKWLLEKSEPNHSLTKSYLQSRGISIAPPPSMELHPRLEYFESIDDEGSGWVGGEYFPTILTRFILGDEMTGIHQTYLRLDGSGKANVESPKKFLKCVEKLNGSSIRLFEAKPDLPLILSEGIETGLAVHEAMGWPVWACGAANFMECVEIPDYVGTVYIAADLDKSKTGQKAAKKLGRRLYTEGKTVHIVTPTGPIPDEAKSVDWLDVLTNGRQS